MSLILTEFDGFSFLTCYSKESITFDFYFTPFQTELWYGLVSVYVLLTLGLGLWMFLERIKTSFCPWLYLLGALLEDGVPIPEKLEKNSIFRLVFGSWIIIGVLFSNCYNGLMITGLHSPLLSSSVTKTFRDLVCQWKEVRNIMIERRANGSNSNFNFDEYILYADGLMGRNQQIRNLYPPKDCFALLSVPKQGSPFSRPEFFAFLHHFYIQYEFDWFTNSTGKLYELQLNLMHPNQRHFPQNTAHLGQLSYSEWVSRVEKEVAGCGKTAQVLPTKFLQSEIQYLGRSYPAAKLYQGQDILQPAPIGISFKNPGISKIPKYYKFLVEAGIYGRINTEFYERTNFRRKRAGEMKPLPDKMTMAGCISTLFIVCVGAAGVGGLVFCGEYCKGKLVLLVVVYFRKIWKLRSDKKKGATKSNKKSNQIAVASVKDKASCTSNEI